MLVLFSHCWWEYTRIQPPWETVKRFPQKLKLETTLWGPATPFLGVDPKELKATYGRYSFIPSFPAASFQGQKPILKGHCAKWNKLITEGQIITWPQWHQNTKIDSQMQTIQWRFSAAGQAWAVRTEGKKSAERHRPRVKSDRQHSTVSSAILLRRCVLLHCVCTRSLHMSMYIYVCIDMWVCIYIMLRISRSPHSYHYISLAVIPYPDHAPTSSEPRC